MCVQNGRAEIKMKLIDLDELNKFPIRLDHYDKEHGNIHFVCGIETVIEYANSLSTVDIPTQKSRWMPIQDSEDGYSCSVCYTYVKAYKGILPNYCPHCGAKMEGERR